MTMVDRTVRIAASAASNISRQSTHLGVSDYSASRSTYKIDFNITNLPAPSLGAGKQFVFHSIQATPVLAHEKRFGDRRTQAVLEHQILMHLLDLLNKERLRVLHIRDEPDCLNTSMS
jgi:hypothetical protein